MPEFYRMRMGWVIFLLAAAATASAQKADSLRAVLASGAAPVERLKAAVAFAEAFGVQRFDETIAVGEAGLALARRERDSVTVARLFRHLGEAWYFKGEYEKAASYFYGSISRLERSEEKKQLALGQNALAKLYRKTRDLPRALQHYERAMELFRQLNDSAGISMIYNESGVVFEYAGDYAKAIERYSASLELDRRRNDPAGIAYALGNLAGAYTLQQQFALAEQYLQQALSVRKGLNDTLALALNYSDLAATYLASGRASIAQRYVDTSNVIARWMGYRDLIRNNYDLMARIARAEGRYEDALELFEKKATLQDSLFNLDKARLVAELDARYQTERRERIISEQQARLRLQRILIWGAVAFVVLGAQLGYSFHRRRRLEAEARMQAEVLRQQELATRAVLEAEEAERQRIAKDLHDGVGQMMSAAKMNLSAFEDDVWFSNEEQRFAFERIISLVDESCKEVRSVSHNMMPNALLKNSLAAAVREFLDKLDHKALKVHLYTEGLEERLDSRVETVLYRVIQECVNNVIKHSGANTLDISIIRDRDEITATVEDNGIGFYTGGSRSEGMGLKNIRTRVEFLKGTVDFDSAPNRGTLVALHIPLAGKTAPGG